MQAIYTKYLGATNTRGGRIKATCDAGSITIPFTYEGSGEDSHRAAKDALCEKLDKEIIRKYGDKPGFNPNKDGRMWRKPMVGGGLPNNMGMAWVFCNEGLISNQFRAIQKNSRMRSSFDKPVFGPGKAEYKRIDTTTGAGMRLEQKMRLAGWYQAQVTPFSTVLYRKKRR